MLVYGKNLEVIIIALNSMCLKIDCLLHVGNHLIKFIFRISHMISIYSLKTGIDLQDRCLDSQEQMARTTHNHFLTIINVVIICKKNSPFSWHEPTRLALLTHEGAAW